MTPAHLKQLMAAVEAWGDRFPPACECGCGDPVRLRHYGMNRYVNRGHAVWGREQTYGRRQGPVIEVAKFRVAVEQIKAAKGWSNRELAYRGGWTPGRLRGVLYGRREYILEDTARKFLRRLAGMPEELTPWERRKVEQEVRAGRRANVEIQNRYMRGA